MDRRKFLVGAGSVPLLGALPGPVFAQTPDLPDYYPADYSQIIEASKSENRLIMYGNIGRDLTQFALDGFSARYPWIQLDLLEVGGTESLERYLAESSAGTASADLIFCDGPGAWVDFGARGEILEYASPEDPHLPEWAVDTNVPGMRILSVSGGIFLWNKLLLAENEQPQTFEELANMVAADPARFDGKLSCHGAHIAAFGYGMQRAFIDGHGEKGWEYLEKVGPATRPERQFGAMLEKLLAGEYLLVYFAPTNGSWNAFKNNPDTAQILGWGYIQDGTPMLARGIAITSKAANPNSAKLMLDYFLSREGQLNLGKHGLSPFRSDISHEDNGDTVLADMVEEIGADNLWIAKYEDSFNTEYDAFIERWRAAYKI